MYRRILVMITEATGPPGQRHRPDDRSFPRTGHIRQPVDPGRAWSPTLASGRCGRGCRLGGSGARASLGPIGGRGCGRASYCPPARLSGTRRPLSPRLLGRSRAPAAVSGIAIPIDQYLNLSDFLRLSVRRRWARLFQATSTRASDKHLSPSNGVLCKRYVLHMVSALSRLRVKRNFGLARLDPTISWPDNASFAGTPRSASFSAIEM
jgi:hypothetical protein